MAAIQRRQRQRAVRVGGVVAAATALLVGGIVVLARKGDDKDVRATTDTTLPGAGTTVVPAATSAAPTTAAASTTAVPTTVPPVAPDVRWAADYLGVEPGPATGVPYKVGWLGADANNPGDRQKLDAMVAYLNANVGGAGGRPIELVPCDYSAAGAPTTCAAQLAANPDIDVVLTDLVEYGPDTYATLNATKAIALAWHGAPSLIGDNAAIFNMDGASGLRSIIEIALDVMAPAAKNIVYVNDIGSGANSANGLSRVREFATDRGVGITFVDVANDATADDIAQALRSTPGALEADAMITYGTTGPWCYNVPAARAQAGSTARLALMDVCVSTEADANPQLSADQAALLEGAYVSGSSSVDLLDARETGLHVYAAATGDQGQILRSSWALFGALLGTVKMIDEHGDIDNVTADDIRSAFSTYHGAIPFAMGPFNCGQLQSVPNWDAGVASCIEYSGVYQYVDGKLTVIANGRNGKLLGFNGLVDADPNLFPPVE